nr:MAG TPA: hypothetical protein [Caudoviricetes sp.]
MPSQSFLAIITCQNKYKSRLLKSGGCTFFNSIQH